MAVGVGRVGGCQHQRVLLFRRIAQPILGAGYGKLTRAQSFDEIATPQASGFLHGLQHGVDTGKAASDALARERFLEGGA